MQIPTIKRKGWSKSAAAAEAGFTRWHYHPYGKSDVLTGIIEFTGANNSTVRASRMNGSYDLENMSFVEEVEAALDWAEGTASEHQPQTGA